MSTFVTERTGGEVKIAQVVRAFYSRPLGWGAMLAVSAALAYAGGGVMFWLHAIYRGEQGPAIGYWQHWFLDSTLGFVALTPAVFLLLPIVLWRLSRRKGSKSRARVGLYVVIVGSLFALVTGPGPVLHNAIAGAETPLADVATDVFGRDPDIARQHAHAPDRSPVTGGLLQIAVGIPVYSLLTLASILVVRKVVGARRRDGFPTPGQCHPRADAGGSPSRVP